MIVASAIVYADLIFLRVQSAGFFSEDSKLASMSEEVSYHRPFILILPLIKSVTKKNYTLRTWLDDYIITPFHHFCQRYG